MKVSLSVVIPVFNEENNLLILCEKIKIALKKIKTDWEIIFVDDGSTDKSQEILEDICVKDKRIKVLSFVKNFGQTPALAAGFKKASGEIVATLDADLQNDPADIPKLLDKIKEGYDVVSGWRKNREDPFLRTLLSSVANLIISKMTRIDLHDTGCTLKVYRKSVLKDLELFGEMHRFLPALLAIEGARITEVEVTHHPRRFGKSNYGFSRTFKVFLDLLTIKFLSSFATKPIYIFGGTGLILITGGIFSGFFVLIRKILLGGEWVSPMLFITILLIIVGVQFLLMGLLAEIQVRTYFASTKKLSYKIKKLINFQF